MVSFPVYQKCAEYIDSSVNTMLQRMSIFLSTLNFTWSEGSIIIEYIYMLIPSVWNNTTADHSIVIHPRKFVFLKGWWTECYLNNSEILEDSLWILDEGKWKPWGVRERERIMAFIKQTVVKLDGPGISQQQRPLVKPILRGKQRLKAWKLFVLTFRSE